MSQPPDSVLAAAAAGRLSDPELVAWVQANGPLVFVRTETERQPVAVLRRRALARDAGERARAALLALVGRAAARGQLAREATRREAAAALGADWPAFAAAHGFDPNEFGDLPPSPRPRGTPPVERPAAPAPAEGPGTELEGLLAELGVAEKVGCGCKAKVRRMNQWGPAGCRTRREQIAGWLARGSPKWGWADKALAAARAVASGLAFRLNPLAPFLSLVDESIRRAEVQAAARTPRR